MSISFYPIDLSTVANGEKKCMICQDAVEAKGFAHDVSLNSNNNVDKVRHIFHKSCFKKYVKEVLLNPNKKKIKCMINNLV